MTHFKVIFQHIFSNRTRKQKEPKPAKEKKGKSAKDKFLDYFSKEVDDDEDIDDEEYYSDVDDDEDIDDI